MDTPVVTFRPNRHTHTRARAHTHAHTHTNTHTHKQKMGSKGSEYRIKLDRDTHTIGKWVAKVAKVANIDSG